MSYFSPITTSSLRMAAQHLLSEALPHQPIQDGHIAHFYRQPIEHLVPVLALHPASAPVGHWLSAATSTAAHLHVTRVFASLHRELKRSPCVLTDFDQRDQAHHATRAALLGQLLNPLLT